MKRILSWAVILFPFLLPFSAFAQTNLATYQNTAPLPTTNFVEMCGFKSSTGTATPITLNSSGALPVTAGGATTTTGTLDMTNAADFDVISVGGNSTATVYFTRTTETGTVSFYASVDGITYGYVIPTSATANDLAGTFKPLAADAKATVSNNYIYEFPVAGKVNFKIDVADAGAGAALPWTVVMSPGVNGVSVSGLFPGVTAAALGTAEDDALPSAKVGVASLMQRNDTISAGGFAGASLDAAFLSGDIHNRAFVNPWGADESEWTSGQNSVITTATTGTIIAATGSASLAWCLTAVNCTNTSAVATRVGILDGATEKWSLMLPAGASDGQTFATPIKGTDNTAWVASVITTGTSTICSATAFKC